MVMVNVSAVDAWCACADASTAEMRAWAHALFNQQYRAILHDLYIAIKLEQSHALVFFILF